jgi:hypothetical protein
MSLLVFELDPSEVSEDSGHPDTDDSLNFEHLLCYLRKQDLVPAITVSVREQDVIVLQGHKYLRAARKLNRRIRAIVDSESHEEAVKLQFKNRPRIEPSLLEHEAAPIFEPAWHVFFFEPALTQRTLEQFEMMLQRATLPETSSMIATAGGSEIHKILVARDVGCIEVLFDTPLGDEGWAIQFLNMCKEFSEDKAQILSYQGRKWRSG